MENETSFIFKRYHQLLESGAYNRAIDLLPFINEGDPLYSEVEGLRAWANFNMHLEDLHIKLDGQSIVRGKISLLLKKVKNSIINLQNQKILASNESQFIELIRRLYARLNYVALYSYALDLLESARQVIAPKHFDKEYQNVLELIKFFKTSRVFNAFQDELLEQEQQRKNYLLEIQRLRAASPEYPELKALEVKALKDYEIVKYKILKKVEKSWKLLRTARQNNNWEDVREQANEILLYHHDDLDAKSAKAEADHQQKLISSLGNASTAIQELIQNGRIIDALQVLNGMLRPIVYPNPYEIVREMNELRDSLRWLLPHWEKLVELVANQQDYSLALEKLNDILKTIENPMPVAIASLLATKKQELRNPAYKPTKHSEKSIYPLNVFVCHASQDKPIIRKLYASLRDKKWIKPWLDEEELLPGQDFDREIQKALRQSDAIILCLSKQSTHREGYIQKEITRALEISEEKPKGEIFIIPLRLDDCNVPDDLKHLQWLDYFTENSQERLIKALLIRSESLKIRRNN